MINVLPIELVCNVVFFLPMKELPVLFSLSHTTSTVLLSTEADEYYWANKCNSDFAQTQKLKSTWRLTYKKCLRSRWFSSIDPADNLWTDVFNSWAMKVVIVGYTGSGKSSLIGRVVRNEFNPHIQSTVGAKFIRYAADNSEYPQYNLRYELWDTSGVGRYESLLPMYLRSSVFVILTFDITDQHSFDKLQGYIDSFKSLSSTIRIWLVGTKSDLESERVIRSEQAQELKRKNSDVVIKYKECSAKDSVNTRELFTEMFAATVRFHRWFQRTNQLDPTAPTTAQLNGPAQQQRMVGMVGCSLM